MSAPSLPEAAACLRAFLDTHLPGAVAIKVLLILPGGQRGSLSLPTVTACASPAPKKEFSPTPFQQRILDALDGVALRTDALGAAVNDRGRLFKKNGLRELRKEGLVKLSEGHGYYRPDSPPENFEDFSDD